MRDVLTRSIDTVMAVDAITRDVQVIEVRGQPTGSCMAIIAGVAAGDVRRVLPGCCDAIVAGSARTEDLCVIDGIGGRKYVGVVAVLTYAAGLNMRGVFAGGIDTVVAVNAIIRDSRVIEIGG